MQETDRDRFDSCFTQPVGNDFNLPFVERPYHLAGGIEPLLDLEGHFAPRQWLRPVKEQVERLDTVTAADRIDVAKACGRQQRGPRPFALKHRIDGDGRAMQHFGEQTWIAIGQAQTFGNAGGRISGHGRGL